MNKKFLSAILFGALMVTATSTFVSCKDYDDDIESLQSQIDNLNSTLSSLQTAVNNGGYITSVTSTSTGLTFTMNNGTSYTVTNGVDGEKGETGATGAAGTDGDKLTVNEDGYWVINDEVTDYVAVTEDMLKTATVDYHSPYVNENGLWVFFDEDGNEEVSTIHAASVTAVQNSDESYTLTVYALDGTSQTIKLPTAASLLSDLILVDGDEATLKFHVFDFNNQSVKIADWKGPRTLPVEKGSTIEILAAVEKPLIQINPTTVDGKDLTYSLVDSKNNVPSNVTLTATDYKELLTRAANENGLYQLSLSETTIASKNIASFRSQFTSNSKDKLYAVKAGSDVRSEYKLVVEESKDNIDLTSIVLEDAAGDELGNSPYTVGSTNGSTSAPDVAINANEWYYVSEGEAEGSLYDMHLSVSSDDATLFGIEIEEEEGVYRFRATKTPDIITKAGFALTVETIANDGTYSTTIIYVGESTQIGDSTSYTVSYQIKDKTATGGNNFSIDLSTMRSALGTTGTALWNTEVDLSQTTITIYDPTAKKNIVEDESLSNMSTYGIIPVITKKVENNPTAATAASDALYVEFEIDNSTAPTYFDVNTEYTATITFNDADGSELNSIEVNFTLTLPDINTLFVLSSSVVKNGVANCYLYADDFTLADENGAPTFDLTRIFTTFTEGYTIGLDDETVVGSTKATSAGLAYMGANSDDASTTTDKDGTLITLSGDLQSSGLHLGYGEELTLTISGDYAGWPYPDEEVFTFTVKIMSPIYEGDVEATNSSVTIPATSLEGYKLGNSDIKGYTYNNITYNVLPDAVDEDGNSDWTRVEIDGVTAATGDATVFTVDELTEATLDDDDNVVDGYFKLNAQNISNTTKTSIKITVEDIWGYKKTSTVPVTVTVE